MTANRMTLEVLNPIKKISTPEKSIELPTQTPFTPDVTIEPEDASIKDLEWETSDSSVVLVMKDGSIQTGVTAGKATLTGKAKDGSGKSIKITVTVPKVYVTDEKITIDTPSGYKLGYQFNSSGIYSVNTKGNAITINSEGDNNNFSWYKINPENAGTGSIVFQLNGKTMKTVKVTVEHSAVYDNVSYPPVSIEEAANDINSYIGKNASFTGTVSDEGKTDEGYYIFCVTEKDKMLYAAGDPYISLGRGDEYDVYGVIEGTYAYTSETGLTYQCPLLKLKKTIKK